MNPQTSHWVSDMYFDKLAVCSLNTSTRMENLSLLTRRHVRKIILCQATRRIVARRIMREASLDQSQRVYHPYFGNCLSVVYNPEGLACAICKQLLPPELRDILIDPCFEVANVLYARCRARNEHRWPDTNKR